MYSKFFVQQNISVINKFSLGYSATVVLQLKHVRSIMINCLYFFQIVELPPNHDTFSQSRSDFCHQGSTVHLTVQSISFQSQNSCNDPP